MLKHPMLSGWLSVQPFQKYVIFVMLIAPLMATSAYSTLAKQTQAAKLTPVTPDSDSASSDSVSKETAANGEQNLDEVAKISQETFASKSLATPTSLAAVNQLQRSHNELEALIENDSLSREIPEADEDLLAAVQLAPSSILQESKSENLSESELDLVQRLKAAKVQVLAAKNNDSASKQFLVAEVLEAATVAPSINKLKPITSVPVVEQPPEGALVQQDPVGSPHPIPWQWIQSTQESIGSKGASGVRYYRSVPVISPDGRYAAYSRVQIEVKPEMHNTRVSSVLFVEDRQTKKLRVVSSTSDVNDPLLKVSVTSTEGDTQGTIGVLVPVSWSEKGDRFLARKFEGYMNTSDVTDRAVIWDRNNGQSQSVTPSQNEHKHEIAVLLGWSKAQPEQVLFRAGELGEETWPMVAVAYDGSTIAANNTDEPVTFGQKVKGVWGDPPVAYR
ncbi:hypothetical protein WA1_16265 [Scytonema hofmannii PCC 7110]|uniref:Uncharacterized protein n=1 Tax=Scytonema hofmannii PCC 7110 TaxID=128403 RepID=A0A139XAE1_9CYAN|nr:hypothetical protein [Scytonema hofmannii]KYC41602.1 hypothetical protein WA1_16265 [Scytonema hofmannii PCC 7110]